MSFRKIIIAAANVYDVFDQEGNYIDTITLVDCCHMGRNMQSTLCLLRQLGCTVKLSKTVGDCGQGFIDESGIFYDRSDAYEIAHNSGQPFNDEYTLPDNKLDSSCIRHFDDKYSVSDYITKGEN